MSLQFREDRFTRLTALASDKVRRQFLDLAIGFAFDTPLLYQIALQVDYALSV